MGGIRSFVKADLSQVTDLVWRVLHQKKGTAPSSLRAYFNEVFLENPWRDDGIVSRVCEDSQGKIVAFFGAVPRLMSINGKMIRIAFGSNFVVDPLTRVTMAAMQLVRLFMKGTQDVSMTDSANEMSQQLLRSLGFTVVPVFSLLWARPLRPLRYFIHGATRLKKSSSINMMGTTLKPLCALGDTLVSKISLNPWRLSKPDAIGDVLDIDTHLHLLRSLPKNRLLPEYDRESLKWLMDFVIAKRAIGDIRKIVVRNREKKILGWYVYCKNPGKVGEVLQIGGDSSSINKVLDHLFYDAWDCGLIGLHGRLEPQFMEELTLKSCFFLRNGSWTLMHCKKPELSALIQSGTAFFSRLDGEWCLRPEQYPS
jgi:hypothetical protein